VSPDPTSRRGPDLPYSVVAGVTPCRGGWLVVGAKLHGTIFAPEDPIRLETFIDVVDQRPAYSVIALNAPVGGLGRGSAVKSAPVHADTPSGTSLLPDQLDAITRTLLPRYQEVANEMAPFRQRTIYEVNADLSFYQLNGDVPMQWSKHSEKGIAERRALLEQRMPGSLRIMNAEVPGATTSHLLDAGAILWTARRIFGKAGVRIPIDPEWDEQGLRMEIVR
jgi:predicted RNase H-like nuclease